MDSLITAAASEASQALTTPIHTKESTGVDRLISYPISYIARRSVIGLRDGVCASPHARSAKAPHKRKQPQCRSCGAPLASPRFRCFDNGLRPAIARDRICALVC